MSELVSQREVAADLGGMRWAEARRLLESIGVRVIKDGPRRWVVLRADWVKVRDALRGVSASVGGVR